MWPFLKVNYSNSIKVDKKKMRNYSFPTSTIPNLVSPPTTVKNTGFRCPVNIGESFGPAHDNFGLENTGFRYQVDIAESFGAAHESLGLNNTLQVEDETFKLGFYSFKMPLSPLLLPDDEVLINFVHYNEKYKDVYEAIEKNECGITSLAVLVVPIKINAEGGDESARKEFNKIIEALDVIEEPGTSTITHSPVDHKNLVPTDINNALRYTAWSFIFHKVQIRLKGTQGQEIRRPGEAQVGEDTQETEGTGAEDMQGIE